MTINASQSEISQPGLNRPLFYPLELWQRTGRIRRLDLALVRLLWQQCPELSQTNLVLFAICSERQRQGHVCLPLHQVADWLSQPQDLSQLSSSEQQWLHRWQQQLALELAEPSAHLPASTALAVVSANSPCQQPMVLDTRAPARLYLHRFWQFEQQLASGILARLNKAPDQALISPSANQLLQQMFNNDAAPAKQQANEQQDQALDWQKLACALAAANHFAIITGGPGTGKTTTVVKLLALLQGERLAQGLPALDIRLCAPTGKAATRLQDSISAQVAKLEPSSDPEFNQQLRQRLPLRVSTLHRLLKPKGQGRGFLQNAHNPLLCDLVVVDEASMVDLELMASLMQALAANTALVLLGDQDQLASVEAGSVLADLCLGAKQGNYWPSTQAGLQALGLGQLPQSYLNSAGSPLAQAVVMLRHSHRFKPDGGIGGLAALVNDAQLSLPHKRQQWSELLAKDGGQELAQYPWQAEDPELAHWLVQGYRPYLQLVQQGPEANSTSQGAAQTEPPLTEPRIEPEEEYERWQDWAWQCLTAFGQFQLLCAVHQGDCGSQSLNQRIEQWLSQAGLIRPQGQSWYPGKPVIISQNDYQLQLMNGDLGLCLPLSLAGQQQLVVVFADPEQPQRVRWFLPSRLQQWQPVYAMTVHKSQGSEFQHCALILPEQTSPLLSKELLYTAITRAKQRFSLICAQPLSLDACLSRQLQRSSGLSLQLNHD